MDFSRLGRRFARLQLTIHRLFRKPTVMTAEEVTRGHISHAGGDELVYIPGRAYAESNLKRRP